MIFGRLGTWRRRQRAVCVRGAGTYGLRHHQPCAQEQGLDLNLSLCLSSTLVAGHSHFSCVLRVLVA